MKVYEDIPTPEPTEIKYSFTETELLKILWQWVEKEEGIKLPEGEVEILGLLESDRGSVNSYERTVKFYITLPLPESDEKSSG